MLVYQRVQASFGLLSGNSNEYNLFHEIVMRKHVLGSKLAIVIWLLTHWVYRENLPDDKSREWTIH